MNSQKLSKSNFNSTNVPITSSPLQSRPFTPNVQAEQGSASQVNQPEKQPPELTQEQQSSFNLSQINLFATGTTPPPPPPTINRFLQTKLTIGQPNDKYEKEADQVAQNVVQQINSPLQAKSQEAEELQTKPDHALIQRQPIKISPLNRPTVTNMQRMGYSDGGVASVDLERQIQRAKGGGQSLDDKIRQPMEQAIGADFSQVKIHADNHADTLSQSIQAKAFTTGNDVFFKKGEYNPGSKSGQALIAHELTHVVQQTGNIQPKHQQNYLQRQDTIIQRLKFDDISNMIGASTKEQISQIGMKAGIKKTDSVANIFAKLVAYGSTNFAYESGMSSLGNGLASNMFNCESISELMVLLSVISTGQDIPAKRNTISSDPVLYKGNTANGGFNNLTPNVTGTNYVVYSNGHTMAEVDGTIYDPVTGETGGLTANYITGTYVERGHCRFVVDGETIDVIATDDAPVGGLSPMRIG